LDYTRKSGNHGAKDIERSTGTME